MLPSTTVWNDQEWPPSDVREWAAALRESSRCCLQRTAVVRERSYTLLGEARARLDHTSPATVLGPPLARNLMVSGLPETTKRRVLAHARARDYMREATVDVEGRAAVLPFRRSRAR